MNRDAHGKNNEENPVAGRRKFMGHALMGGVAAFVPMGPVSFSPVEAETQTCTATAADSLVFYLTLLLSIPYELLANSGGNMREAAAHCSRQLDSIYQKVKELEVELRRVQSKAQTSRLRNVIELARTNTELIRTSGKPQLQHATLLANTIGVVGREVANATEELEPDQEIKLSTDAQRILNEIIALAREAPAIQKKINLANAQFNDALKLVKDQILGDPDRPNAPSIAKLMLDASNAIFMAERGGNSVTQRESAAAKIQAVIDRLNTVRSGYPQRTLGSAEKPAATDLLVGLLEGAKAWVTSSKSVGVEDLTQRSHVRNKTGSREVLRSVAPAPGQISNLLDRHCGPGTWWRTGWCLGLVTPALFRHSDAASRLPLIRGALDLFSCPGEPADKTRLAKGIANLRIS